MFKRGYVMYNGFIKGLELSNARDKAHAILVMLYVVAVAGVLAYVIFTPGHGESYTEFYLLGADHRADSYPTTYQLGDTRPITIGVVNHEGRTMDYEVIVQLNNTTATSKIYSSKVHLADNQTLEWVADLKPDLTGNDQKMSFLLYADGNMTAPYRECNLWVNVMPVKEG